MTQVENLIGDYRQWIEKIRGEIIKLFFMNHIFWEIQGVIRDNPKLEGQKNYFYEWAGDAFVYSSAMFVRRQVDKTKGTISFSKLLEKIARNSKTLNRSDFVSRAVSQTFSQTYPHGNLRIEADRIFDELVGIGKEHLEKSLIQEDLKQLVEKSKKFETFANHFVAHHSQNEMPTDKPTFSDLDDCIKLMITLLEKYYLLITGDRMKRLDETESFDPAWKDIFTFPWINVIAKSEY